MTVKTASQPSVLAETADRGKARIRAKIFQRSKLWFTLFLLMAPTLVSMLVFSYYPKLDVIRYALYRWTPGQVEEFIGLRNFREVISDRLFIQSFSLVLILLAANLVKMWPSIFTAIVLHRLRSQRLRYFFQVTFVIPMVIPGLVWLLIWKSFFDPNVGILNKLLNITGMMDLLDRLDAGMPWLAGKVSYAFKYAVDPAFGSVWGLGILGFLVLLTAGGTRNRSPKVVIPSLVGVAAYAVLHNVLIGPVLLWLGGDAMAWPELLLRVGPVLVVTAMMTERRRWFLFALLLIPVYGLMGPLRYGVAVPAVLGMVYAFTRMSKLMGPTWSRWVSMGLLTLTALLVVAGKTWTRETNAFEQASPAWLANPDLIIPAVVFWGFPWIGVVGVLIYLAGLQRISQDVYEAAELDGVGSIGKIFRIELPLIMTQVRINLIFMTMTTLTTYGMFLLLLGPEGGPDGKGVVPGLYMYQKAFIENRYGYACALGMVMFVMILILTIIYQKYVKVEK